MSDLISLAQAKRSYGIGKSVLKAHLPIIDAGYRSKFVKKQDVEDLIRRLTVLPSDSYQSEPTLKPQRKAASGRKKRDLLG
jgi:hypothetical protein